MRNKLLLKLSFLLVAGIILVSCKQDAIIDTIKPNTDRVIAEFTDGLTGGAVNTEFSSNIVTVDLTGLQLNTRSKTYNNVKVKFVVNPTVVADYNAANGTSYILPPVTAYNFESNEVTLSQKERKQMIRIGLIPSLLVSGSYAIGLSISEVSEGEISKTAQNVLVILSVKNKYDGIYSLKGYANIPSSVFIGPFSLPCSASMALITSGTSSVYLDPGQAAPNGAAIGVLTNVLPDFLINPTTNAVTGVTGRTGSLAIIFPLDATYNSRYDPATKTIYVKYGVSSVASGRYFIDTLVYCGPR